MKSLSHLNKYFYKYRVRLLLGVLFVGLSNYFAVDSIRYVREAINYVSLNKDKVSYDVVQHELLIYGLKIVGMALLMGLFMFFMRQTIIIMSRLIEYDLKNEIYEQYQKLDQAFYKRNNTGDLMNRISEDVSRVRMYIGPAIMYVVNTIGTFVLTIIVMLHVDSRLTLYVLLPLPVLAFSIYMVSETINKKSTIVQAQLSRLSTFTQESLSGIRILKAYNREVSAIEVLEEESFNYRKKNLNLVRTEALFQPFMILLIGLSTVLTIYVGGKATIEGRINMGNIAEFILYINRLTWPIASLGFVTSLIQRAAASQTRINEFLTTKPSIINPSVAPEKFEGVISFRNVSFAYENRAADVLKNISFEINKGESLAIIGKTGSGKSTIATLIARLYDVSSGEILIDGKNIKDVNLDALRDQIGYVPQEVFLFSDTIAKNISFSYSNEDEKKANIMPLIEQAAKDAAIYDNIMEFNEKFDTMVGERGITLSGGQKQRISIARAIIKSPQILMFDDCLSAVDTETEEEILTNLKRIMKNKTSIIISHRVSSVKHADQIIVLEDGAIIERGTHQSLLNAKGSYYELYQKQLVDK